MSNTNKKQIDPLVAALSEMENPHFDQQNPHFKSSFASLGACLAAVKPVLAKHGLAVIQPVSHDEQGVEVKTIVIGGEEDRTLGHVSMPVGERPTPQQIGSAITYARRYGLCAAFGIVGEPDDDGNAATEAAKQLPKKVPAKKAAAKPDALINEKRSTKAAIKDVDDGDDVPGNLHYLTPGLLKMFDEAKNAEEFSKASLSIIEWAKDYRHPAGHANEGEPFTNGRMAHLRRCLDEKAAVWSMTYDKKEGCYV